MKILSSNQTKITIVIVFSVIITSLTIKASDKLILNDSRGNSECGIGTKLISLAHDHHLCVDVYEASAGESCLYPDPQNELESEINIGSQKCLALSVSGVTPWRFVSQANASQLCAKRSMRLPTAKEWYLISLEQNELEQCILDQDSVGKTGSTNCKTNSHIYDLVGNVWEWTSDVAREGIFQDQTLPTSGYVSDINSSGVVTETQIDEGKVEFGYDYASVSNVGERGVMRGGYYASRSDGGIFTQNISSPPSFKGAGVGFRCVKDFILP